MNTKKSRPAIIKEISINKLLWGGDFGFDANKYSKLSGNILRSSTMIKDTPHVQLLLEFIEKGESLFRKENYEKSAYYKNALFGINKFGNYFNITDEEKIIFQIERFINHYKKIPAPRIRQQSGDDTIPIVSRNAFSDCYEVRDGHHRLAIDFVNQKKTVKCQIVDGKSITVLQELVVGNSWTKNELLLYQPINLPEFDKFTLVRKCHDRLSLIQSFLSERTLTSGNYVDLACSFGYFVSKMNDFGLHAEGVDSDQNSLKIAHHYFGVPINNLHNSSLEDFLESDNEYDIVSALSIFHHYIGGFRECRYPAELLFSKISKATKKVLFFDMGQNHEQWFKTPLREWDNDRIIKFLKENGEFIEILPLGTDTDNVGIYSNNYGRTLFACVK